MITQEEKVDQVRSVTLDCQWGTGERLPPIYRNEAKKSKVLGANYENESRRYYGWRYG